MRQSPELIKAFRWKTTTLPSKYKSASVSYYQAIEVALIGGLTFGAAVLFLQQAFYSINLVNWAVSIVFGLLAIYVQLAIYRQVLKD